jgi:hypothetical protein
MVKTCPIARLFFLCDTVGLFLRSYIRKKNGKLHEYFSVVENRRLSGEKTIQWTVLYLGEITSSQESTWRKTLKVFDEDSGKLDLPKQPPPKVYSCQLQDTLCGGN